MSWLRRRMMANFGGGLLPSGYTPVGWIQTRANMASSQSFDFFDLGIVPTTDIEMEAVFNQNGKNVSPSYAMFVGSRLASQKQEFMALGYQNIGLSYNGRKSLGYWPNTEKDYNWNTYSFVGNTLDVNGHTLTISRTSGSAAINNFNLFLGALNQNGSATQAMVCTIKELSISIGGVNHEYIPCINSLGQAGLFDLAAQSFIAPHGGSYLIHKPVDNDIMLNFTPKWSVFYFIDPIVIDFYNGEYLTADITCAAPLSTNAVQRILTVSLISPFAPNPSKDTIHFYYRHSDAHIGWKIGSMDTYDIALSQSRFRLDLKLDGIYINGERQYSDMSSLFYDQTNIEWYISSTEGVEYQRSNSTYHRVTIVRP